MRSKFKHALDGLYPLFMEDKNFRLQVFLGLITLLLSILLQISKTEWLIVLGCIASVIYLEIINSCVERICDFIHPEYHKEIKFIKDCSAAAVLVASIFSFAAALIIYIPKILHYAFPIH